MNKSLSISRLLNKCIYRNIFNFSKNKNDFGNCNLVQKGKVSAERPVPDDIVKPKYYYKPMPPSLTIGQIEIKNNGQIISMRESCKLAANILNRCESIIEIGTTTDAIDAFVHSEIISAKAYPSPLRYGGFPKSVCTSVNNVACHGIPDDRPLMDGDIINVDITVFLRGFHGDCSKTFMVGGVDDRGQHLVEVTQKCLDKAIEICGPNVPFSRIGEVIEDFTDLNGLTVVPSFIGHGIGEYFHGPPEIMHYRNDFDDLMKPGMTFTIEPILTLGGMDIEIQEDNWTAITMDNARTAQFEHTILITNNGSEILTLPD